MGTYRADTVRAECQAFSIPPVNLNKSIFTIHALQIFGKDTYFFSNSIIFAKINVEQTFFVSFCKLKGDEVLSKPGGVDIDTRDGGRGSGGTIEECSGKPGDMVLVEGNIERPFVEYVIFVIKSSHRKVDSALNIMQERIEVELLLPVSDIEDHRLLAVDKA